MRCDDASVVLSAVCRTTILKRQRLCDTRDCRWPVLPPRSAVYRSQAASFAGIERESDAVAVAGDGSLAAGGVYDLPVLGGVEHGAGAGDAAFQRGLDQLAAAPRHCHGNPAPSAQPRHAALRPRGRQGGQQVEFAAVALQQHFDHRRRSAEIAVDLEDARRVQVQERIGGEVGDEVV